jgi:hypothetical protein
VGGGTFTINGGKISGNILYSRGNVNSRSYGGGVYVYDGTFTMNGGVIFGHTVPSYGGGVYVSGSINKTGGTIFGYSEGDSKSNVVKDSSEVVLQNRGHAIYVYHSNAIYNGIGKDATSGPGDNLSFNGTVNPPSYSGDWDY